MTVTAGQAWRWLDDRFNQPVLGSPPSSSIRRTVVLNDRPPTCFWRRMTWLVLSAPVPFLLAVASLILPEPADGFLFDFAVCVCLGLVFAVLTAAISSGIHPGEWWWLFPAAWLGWSAAFTPLALVIWVLAS